MPVLRCPSCERVYLPEETRGPNCPGCEKPWNASPTAPGEAPKAQELLKPFLAGRDDNAYIFSLFESELERRAEKHKERKAHPLAGNKCESIHTKTFQRAKFKQGSGYTNHSYRKAVRYTCKRARIAAWHPNQIRHSTATALRKKHGIEAASVLLGHTNLKADRDKAKEIARGNS